MINRPTSRQDQACVTVYTQAYTSIATTQWLLSKMIISSMSIDYYPARREERPWGGVGHGYSQNLV